MAGDNGKKVSGGAFAVREGPAETWMLTDMEGAAAAHELGFEVREVEVDKELSKPAWFDKEFNGIEKVHDN